LFVAGADSSSTAVEWAMAELLRGPEAMTKVKEELKRVLGNKTQVEESDIGQLPYLQAVVKEVLRLHPPVAMTFYRAEATVSVLGYQIPEGTTIILNIWAVHRNKDTFVNPDKFEPERFMNTETDFSGKDCNNSIWWRTPHLAWIAASIWNGPLDFGITTASVRLGYAQRSNGK
jgi:cytochrome P450